MIFHRILFLVCVLSAGLASGDVLLSSVSSETTKAAAQLFNSRLGDAADARFVLDKRFGAADGYCVSRSNGVYVIAAGRPRGFLYAAGEPELWRDVGAVPFVRKAPFRTRLLMYGKSAHPVAEWIAATGANAVQLSGSGIPEQVAACHAADVEAYAFLYGCDPMKWGAAECEAYLAAHPTARGVDPGRSWEKGVMCPSDPATAEFFRDKIRALATATDVDGVVVTLWDTFGLYCQCERCRKSGLNQFAAEIAACVRWFEEALKPLGKKLVVRTWSSGAPHFLRDEWVHAPGYASAEEAIATWGKAFAASDPKTVFQTKVYNADCQPNPPFSLLLGRAKGRTEFAEWQIAGQTVGLQWLPASVVDHTAETMRRAARLVGADGGVALYTGGYNCSGYEALDDIANSVNVYAWRRLSWNPDEDVDAIWRDWATKTYGAKAGERVAAALRLSERATAASFSPLGLGAPTESRFAGSVSRREDLLRYTNRQYLPEGKAALAPTRENIARVVAEKDAALAQVDAMLRLVNDAAPQMDAAKAKELLLRIGWLRTHLVVSRALDGALWRLRYLRAESQLGRTDMEVFAEIERDFETIRRESGNLFAHDADLELSGYRGAVGDREISLRSPIPLMRDIESEARKTVERFAGPARMTRTRPGTASSPQPDCRAGTSGDSSQGS